MYIEIGAPRAAAILRIQVAWSLEYSSRNRFETAQFLTNSTTGNPAGCGIPGISLRATRFTKQSQPARVRATRIWRMVSFAISAILTFLFLEMANPLLWLIVNLIATWFMVGLIWMVQVVHYPLFSQVGEPQFVEYQRLHGNRISPVVGIPMLIELSTAVLLCIAVPDPLRRPMMVVGLILVAVIWLSTAFIQVPAHTQLSSGFNDQAHSILVVSNWIRTLAWTVRGLLMAYACWLVMNSRSA